MVVDSTKVKDLASRFAGEALRKADGLARESYRLRCLAPLQPPGEGKMTQMEARQKSDKARQLRRIAGGLTRSHQNETGPGVEPGPVVIVR